MAASVEATFKILDRASGTIDKIKSKATEADAATGKLGNNLDKLGSADKKAKIDTTAKAVKNIGDTSKTTAATAKISFDDFKRTIDSATRKVEGDAAKMKAALTAIEGKYTPEIEIEGVGSALAAIRVLKQQLRSLEQQQARAAMGGLVGASGAALGTAAQGGSALSQFFGRAASMAALMGTRMVILASAVTFILLPGIIALTGALSALVGSMGAAAIGAVALGSAIATIGVVGLAGTLAIMIPTISKLKEAKKEQDNYTKAVKEFGAKSDQAAKARDKFNQAMEDTGSPTQTKRLFRLQRQVGNRWNRITARGRNDAIGMMADGLSFLERRLPALGRIANRSMSAVREGMGNFLDRLGDRRNMRVLDRLSGVFSQITPQLGTTFGNLATFMLRLADAARPQVLQLFHAMERWSGGLVSRQEMPQGAARTGNPRINAGLRRQGAAENRSAMNERIGQLRAWVRLIREAGKLAVAFFGAGAHQGQSLVQRMTRQLRTWRQEIERDPRKLQRWFKSTIEDATTLANEFGRMARSVAELADDVRGLIGPLSDIRKALSGAIPGDNSIIELITTYALLRGGGKMAGRILRRGGGKLPGRAGGLFRGGAAAGGAAEAGAARGGAGLLGSLGRAGAAAGGARALAMRGGSKLIPGVGWGLAAMEGANLLSNAGVTATPQEVDRNHRRVVRQHRETQNKIKSDLEKYMDDKLKKEKQEGDKTVKITKDYGGAARTASRKAWAGMADDVDKNNKKMRSSTHVNFQAIMNELRQKLGGLGIKGADLSSSIAGSKPGSGGANNTGSMFARGGRVQGHDLGDNYQVRAGAGEIVMNRHTEKKIDALLGGKATVDTLTRNEGRPHSAPLARAAGRGPGGSHIFHRTGGRAFPDAMGALPGLDALAFIMKQKFGLNVVSGLRPGAITTSGNPSDHGWGGAIDISNGITTPQMDAAYKFLSGVAGIAPTGGVTSGGPIKQMLYKTMVGGNHFNHIHVALQQALAHDAAAVYRIFSKGGKFTGGMLAGVQGAVEQLKKRKGFRGAGSARQAFSQRAIDNLTKAGNRKLGGTGAMGGNYDGPLNRVFPSHSAGQPGVQLAPRVVAALANKAGLPGSTFEQIAHGESNYMPGVISSDGGYGLWQMTPRVWGAAGVQKMNQLGGVKQMLNPWKNALMAKYLYTQAGNTISPWYGTKYVSGRATGGRMADWGGSFGAGGRVHASRPTMIEIGESGSETATINRGRASDSRAGGGRAGEVTVHIDKIVYHGEGDIERVVSREFKKVAHKLNNGEDARDLMD